MFKILKKRKRKKRKLKCLIIIAHESILKVSILHKENNHSRLKQKDYQLLKLLSIQSITRFLA